MYVCKKGKNKIKNILFYFLSSYNRIILIMKISKNKGKINKISVSFLIKIIIQIESGFKC